MEWLQETRKMRFEEVYEGCKSGCLTQTKRRCYLVFVTVHLRYSNKYDEGGLEALLAMKQVKMIANKRPDYK